MALNTRISNRIIVYIGVTAICLLGLSSYWLLHNTPSADTAIHFPIDSDRPNYPGSSNEQNSSSVGDYISKPKSPYTHIELDDLVGSEGVQVVFKTGATEVLDKLPVHFVTTLTHVPNFLFFSDIDQVLGDYVIYDSLDEISERMKAENGDFELYRQLKKIMPLRQDPKRLKLKGGWELDKYKNVHILQKAYRINPSAKWYIFIDADTYVLWPNLLRWLNTLDHTKPLYMGSPTYVGDVEFGHGGTGYILSQGAIQKTVAVDPEFASKYEEDAARSCCGDHILGKSMLDNGIHLTKSWPKLNGEPPYLIPFTDEQWCQPIVTLHHMLPVDIEDMWAFERENATVQRPIIYADVFEHFIQPFLVAERDDWWNQSNDWEYIPELEWDPEKHGGSKWSELTPIQQNAHASFDSCKQACKENQMCFQFMLTDSTCALSRKVKLGWKETEGSKKRKSGWLLDRIESLRQSKNPCGREGW